MAKEECEECGAKLIYDRETKKIYCNLCGWSPEEESDLDETPSYIG